MAEKSRNCYVLNTYLDSFIVFFQSQSSGASFEMMPPRKEPQPDLLGKLLVVKLVVVGWTCTSADCEYFKQDIP